MTDQRPSSTATPAHTSSEPQAELNEAYTPLRQDAPYPRELLKWRERLAIRIGASINRPGMAQNISMWWGKNFTCRVLHRVTGHRWEHIHRERFEAIETQRPILVVSNHRTFFDMYVGITALRYATDYRLGRYLFFPVRAPFFYDKVLGVFTNLLFAGGCMWPPVCRDDRRGQLNPVTVDLINSGLRRERMCLGFHPEGRRSKSDDPYTLEPPKRGVGDLIQAASDDLCILPLFISGLSGDVKREWRLRKLRKLSKRGQIPEEDKIKLYWGEPKRVSDYQGDSLEIAKAVHADIQALADEAREAEGA